MRKMATLAWRAHFRPTFSVTVDKINYKCVSQRRTHLRRKQKMAPKKAPAWKAEVILLEMSAASFLLMLKSVLKLSRAMVVPTKAESYPKLPHCQNEDASLWKLSVTSYRSEPVAMMPASVYNRQLYTSFGVGRSSTARKPPILFSCSFARRQTF